MDLFYPVMALYLAGACSVVLFADSIILRHLYEAKHSKARCDEERKEDIVIDTPDCLVHQWIIQVIYTSYSAVQCECDKCALLQGICCNL